MVYLDTNVLIYATVEQDKNKHKESIELIEKLAFDGTLLLSPLVLQEFIFTMNKLSIDKETMKHDVTFYFDFVSENYSKIMLEEALSICLEDENCKNINDILHMKLATKYADKLITYDSDFKKLQKYTDIDISILK